MARSCKLLPKTEVTLVLTWTSHVRFALFHSHSLNLRPFLFVHLLEEQVLLLFTTKQFSTKVLSSFLLSSFSFQPLQRPSIRDSPHTAIKSSQRDAANGVIDQMIKDTETRARATKAKPLTIADIEAVMRLGVANSKIYMLCTPPPLLTSSATTVLSLFRR